MKPLHTTFPRSFGKLDLWSGLWFTCALVLTAQAQFSYSEDFKNSTAPGWVLNPAGNSAIGATLTSGLTPRSGDAATGVVDPSGSGWLRLTNNTTSLNNAVYFDTPIPSAGNSVTIQFGVNLWNNGYNGYTGPADATRPYPTGADGLTFFLYDASKPFVVGARGGAIGYAQMDAVNSTILHDGLNGGFVGIALDPYGNFSTGGIVNDPQNNITEGKLGGGTTLKPNTVAVRGPGQGQTGYNYLAGTGGKDYTDTGSPTVLDGTDGNVPAVPYPLAFPGATTRPNQSTQYRNVSVTLNENSQLAVSMQFGENGLWVQLLDIDLTSFVRPEQLKLGFSAGTGGGTLITEVGGLLQITATAGTGNFIWDKRNGPGDLGVGGGTIWGTGTNDPLNWAGQTNPTLKSNVIFNSTYLGAVDPQSISVNGSDKVITNMYFSGKNSYSLTTGDARKLIFDSNTPGGLTAINLTSDIGGNAAHTIGLAVQMNQNLDINNNISPTFTISGNIDGGGNVLGLKGTGTTVLAGAISGTGSLVKNDSGTARLTGASANTYSGNTTVTLGTLQIEKATALGSTAAGTTVSAGGTLALAGSGTTFAAEGLTLNGDGVSNAGALRNVAGANTWIGTVALGTTGSNSIGVDAGSLNISGVISGTAGKNLTKVGNGTLTLSGTNTYSGNTTINAGTVAISGDGATGGNASNLGTVPASVTAGNLTFNGGTLQNTAVTTLNANRGVTLGASGGTFQTDANLTYNGIATGAGALTKTGNGTMILGGLNTYTGATNINAGTLQLGITSALGNTTAVTVATGATLNVNNQTNTIGSLAGGGAVTLGTGTLTTGNDNTSTAYTGTVTGTGSVTKTGNGTMTIGGTDGANSFAPSTLTLNQGTVRLGANNILAGAVVFNGGTLSVNGKNETVASASVTASSILDFNSLAGVLDFTTGSYTGGTLTINNWAGSTAGGGASQLLLPGSITGALLANITFAGYAPGAQRIGNEIVPITGAGFTWNVDADGSWSNNANWSPATGNPNAIDAPANFASAIFANRTVTLDTARTVGYINFNDDNNYTLTHASNRLTLDVTTGSAQINVSSTGSPTISAGLTLNDALTINQNSTGTLTLSAANAITGNATNQNVTVNGAGNTTITGTITTGTGTLTKNNSGTLTLSGVNTFTGATTINGGTVVISAESGLGNNPGSLAAGQLTLNGGTIRTETAAVTIDDANRGVTIGTSGGTFETATDLTIGSAGNTNNVVTMTGALTKTGSGTLTLAGNGANTGNGAVTITTGSLTINKGALVSAIGDTSAVTVGSGAFLKFNSAAGAYNAETVGSIAGAGTIDNLSSTAFTLNAGGNNGSTVFTGVIQDTGTGSLALTKSGNGTLTLSGVNDYSGVTTISAGAINIQSNTALGNVTAAGNTTVTSGAALEVQNNITTGELVTLNGAGVSVAPLGALRNVSGNNTLTGAITLGSASTLRSDANTLTLSGGITGAVALTVTGDGNTSVNSVIGIGAGTLTKSGNGTLTLSGNNTYTGATTIGNGTLEIQNGGGLGTTGNGTTVSTGATLALSNNIASAEPITLNSTGVGSLGAIRNLSGANTLSGALTLGSASSIGVDGVSALTASGVIGGTSKDLTKVGTGTLILSAANTYTGTTAVSAGTLQINNVAALGTVTTTVATGATLRVTGNNLTIAEPVTLAGSGVSNLGSLQSSGGSNTWSSNLTMVADSAIGVDGAANTLSATGTLASSGGSYDLTKVGNGTLTLSGVNTYTGATTVRDGTLSVNSNAPVSGNGALGSSGSTVQVGDASTLATNNLGLVIGTNGNVTLARAITVNNFNTSGTVTLGGTNTTGTNVFTGNIGLGKDTFLTSATTGNVTFSGDLSGSGAITANGNGTVTLSGNNSLTGAATVNSGATLVAASNNALGGTTAGTSVNSGGTLGLQGGITVPAAEAITLTGSASPTIPALRNLSGTNTVSGPVTLAGAASDTVILNATAGAVSLAGAIGESGGSKNITTTGAGTINLSATNTVTGNLILNGSTGATVALAAGGSLSNIGNITVNTGNTLSFGANNQVSTATNLALAGGTVNLGGFTQTMRTLSANASGGTLDYLNDTSKLTFNFNNATNGLGTLGAAISIANWAGSLTGNGAEQLVVYSSTNIAGAVANINFTGWGTGTNNATAISLGGGLYEIVPTVTATDWKTGSATWLTGANWNPTTAPNSSGAIARFGNFAGVSGNPTVDIAAAGATAGILLFDSGIVARNYTVSGPGTLTLNNGGSSAQINLNDDNSHTISAPSNAASPVVVTNNSSAATGLTISGNMAQSAAATSLTFTGSGRTAVTGNITQTAGSTALVKTGSGTLALTGTNTFTGGTTLRNGTIELNSSGALGSAGTVTINDASTTSGMNTSLLFGAGATGLTLSRGLSIGTQGAATTLGGLNTTGTNTYSGAITLNKTATLTAETGGTVAFTGVLSGTGGINKTGNGTVSIGGTASNTFTGNVDIQAGTLQLAKSGGGVDVIGAVQGAIGDLASVNLSAASTVLSIANTAGGYTLEEIGSLSGVATSNVNLTGNSTFNLYTGNNSLSTTFAGTLTNTGGTISVLNLVKQGTGTMTLSGNNTYAGTTLVSAGTLVAANNTALGNATTAGNTTVTAGATLGFQGGITVTGEGITLNSNSSSPATAALANLSGDNASTGAITLTAATANDAVKIDAAGGSQLTLSGAIGQGANAAVLAKTGTGTVVLSGANTYTGITNVSAGTLIVANATALGNVSAGTSVQIGATLGIQNNITVASGETYTLNGTTNPPGAPSLKNISGTNTLAGNIALSGGINTGVSIDSNVDTLALTGVISQTSNPNFIIKTGSGDLSLGGTVANTFSGGLTINDGKVIATKTAGVAATGAGNVFIGDSTGAAASATLQLNASNQINNASNVTIATDGKLDLQTNSDTIGALTMTGGSVTASGAGTLALGGNLTFTGIGANTAAITANVDLNITGTRIVQVGNNGTVDTDLTINGVISGTSSSFNKTDLGVLEIAGSTSNTFTGGFQVSDGTVFLNKTAGTNATGAGLAVTVGDNINAANTAKLTLSQSNQITDAATVTVNSDGKFDLNGLTETIGAIAGTGNIETRAGTLRIFGANSVSTFSGTLTDSTGTIVAETGIPGYTNGYVSSVGSGRAILEAGTGSLTFNSNIAFAGTFELKSGTLFLPGVNFTVGTLEITGNTILDFGNSAATVLNATNIKIAQGASLTINNWVNNVDFFFAQNWLLGSGASPPAVPGINTRGVGAETSITFQGFSNNQTAWLDYNNGNKHEITPAPEPATYGAMFMGAALALLGYRRWKRSASPAKAP